MHEAESIGILADGEKKDALCSLHFALTMMMQAPSSYPCPSGKSPVESLLTRMASMSRVFAVVILVHTPSPPMSARRSQKKQSLLLLGAIQDCELSSHRPYNSWNYHAAQLPARKNRTLITLRLQPPRSDWTPVQAAPSRQPMPATTGAASLSPLDRKVLQSVARLPNA
jgi:hypothetical protein